MQITVKKLSKPNNSFNIYCSFIMVESSMLDLSFLHLVHLWSEILEAIKLNKEPTNWQILTISTNLSQQANRILSTVAGDQNWNGPVIPLSALALFTASLIAKKTEAAKKRGGSPIPCTKKRNSTLYSLGLSYLCINAIPWRRKLPLG